MTLRLVITEIVSWGIEIINWSRAADSGLVTDSENYSVKIFVGWIHFNFCQKNWNINKILVRFSQIFGKHGWRSLVISDQLVTNQRAWRHTAFVLTWYHLPSGHGLIFPDSFLKMLNLPVSISDKVSSSLHSRWVWDLRVEQFVKLSGLLMAGQGCNKRANNVRICKTKWKITPA